MTITYSLKPTKIEVRDENNFVNVVKVVFFDYIGVDNDGRAATVSGSANIFFDPGSEFTTFESLEESDVVAWVMNTFSRGVFENYERIIEEEFNKASSHVTLPWS